VTQRLVAVVLAVEAVAVVACLVCLVISGLLAQWRRRRQAAAMTQARRAVRAVALGEAPSRTGVRALEDLPLHEAMSVLGELSRSVNGAALDRIRNVAVAAGLSHKLEQWSISRRWWRRLRALRLLSHLHVGHETIPRFLADKNPVVRSAAADAVARSLTTATADRLLGMLDDEAPLCRFSAKVALMSGGPVAASRVRAYLMAGQRPRIREALEIAATLADHQFQEPALRHAQASDHGVRRAAAVLLARTAGEAASQRLTELLGDVDEGVRAAAATGLGALGHWPAAPALAAALEDPAWVVRSAAAVALRRVGPSGRIYLRGAARNEGSSGAQVAGQVLALPDGALSVMSA
jgi:hypothetical protein